MKYIKKIFESNSKEFIKECFVEIMDGYEVNFNFSAINNITYIRIDIGRGYIELNGNVEQIKQRYKEMSIMLDKIYVALEKINSNTEMFYNIDIGNDGEKSDCIEVSLSYTKFSWNHPIT